MKVTVMSTSPSQRVMEVTVDKDEVEKAYRQAFKERRKHLKVKGFRKGNVPDSIAKQYLTDAHLVRRVVNILVPSAYKEALKSEQLSPLGKPDWGLKQSERGEDLVFEATLHVMPVLEIEGYKGFPIERDAQVVDETQIDQILRERQQSAAHFLDRPPEHPAEVGDYAFIDYLATHNGHPVPQASVKNFLLELRLEKFLPGFVESLLGIRAGERRKVVLTLPVGYADRRLAGEEVEFTVKVHQLRQRHMPALTDEFAKKFGNSVNLAELRTNIRQGLEAKLKQTTEEEVTNEIVKSLVNRIDISSVPAQLADGHARFALRTQTKSLDRQGLTIEQYLTNRAISSDHFEEELKLTGLVEARLEILYRSIAAAEKITVMKKEIDQAIVAQAKARGQSAKELKARMLKDDTYRLLAYRILIAKVRKALFEQADISYRDPEQESGKFRIKSVSKKRRAASKSKKTVKRKATKKAPTKRKTAKLKTTAAKKKKKKSVRAKSAVKSKARPATKKTTRKVKDMSGNKPFGQTVEAPD
jgi:trigger factor